MFFDVVGEDLYVFSLIKMFYKWYYWFKDWFFVIV